MSLLLDISLDISWYVFKDTLDTKIWCGHPKWSGSDPRFAGREHPNGRTKKLRDFLLRKHQQAAHILGQKRHNCCLTSVNFQIPASWYMQRRCGSVPTPANARQDGRCGSLQNSGRGHGRDWSCHSVFLFQGFDCTSPIFCDPGFGLGSHKSYLMFSSASVWRTAIKQKDLPGKSPYICCLAIPMKVKSLGEFSFNAAFPVESVLPQSQSAKKRPITNPWKNG